MNPRFHAEPATLTAREADAKATLRRLRGCSREIERLAARTRTGRRGHHPSAAAPLEQRVCTLTAESEHIRLELANWAVVSSRSWAEQLDARVDRLASAIAAAQEPEPRRVQRDRVVVWPRRAAKRVPQTADEVERVIYDYLYPRPRPAAVVG